MNERRQGDVSSRPVNRIYGVDFSAAKDAGRRIWIAAGAVWGDTLRIERCGPAERLPDSGRGRDESLSALRTFVAGSGACAFGFDFPFGLPRALVRQDDWEPFVLSFPGEYASPEAFRRSCRETAGGRELKRVTDREARTPFSPYNLRLFRQTYHGIRDLLHPWVRDRLACVLPMQGAAAGRPWVLEICPASTLKARWDDLYVPYKGATHERRVARERILDRLEVAGAVSIPDPAVRARVLDDDGGDALDSVIAAFATLEALRDVDPADEAYLIEGYVYV